jgi:hypothetical protein
MKRLRMRGVRPSISLYVLMTQRLLLAWKYVRGITSSMCLSVSAEDLLVLLSSTYPLGPSTFKAPFVCFTGQRTDDPDIEVWNIH